MYKRTRCRILAVAGLLYWYKNSVVKISALQIPIDVL